MDENRARALYVHEHGTTRDALVRRVPKAERERIAQRAENLRAAWACPAHGIPACACGADAPRANGSIAATVAALPFYLGRDHRPASAARTTRELRATGRALACLDPQVTGALVRAPQRVRSDDSRRVERAQDAACGAAELRRSALDSLDALRAEYRRARGRKARERARSRYRAACHRLGVRP